MYFEGHGVAQDDKQAAAQWLKAAEQGHAEA
jgi:TPR repeat protein